MFSDSATKLQSRQLMAVVCCCWQGVISRREVDLFSFSLPQATNDTRPYRLLLILRTVDGDAQL
jgi:hypothetical protein